MKEDFINYLRNLYWMHAQYNLSKAFGICASAVNCEEMCIWEYEGLINISDHYDYVNIFTNVYMLNNSDEDSLPNILYQTDDKNEMSKIRKAVFIKDYEEMIKELLRVINNDKTLSLVDNGSRYKYN